jgi:hypothetical protein
MIGHRANFTINFDHIRSWYIRLMDLTDLSPVVTICTTYCTIQNFASGHREYLCVPCGSNNKVLLNTPNKEPLYRYHVITSSNQLSAEAVATFPCKSHMFRK